MSGWSRPLEPWLERRLARLADLGERAVVLVLFAALAARVIAVAGREPWNLAILAPDGLAVVFIIFRRRPRAVSGRPMAWVAALLGATAPMLVSPGGAELVSPAAGLLLIGGGLILSLWAKLTLRRSFGLAPANRGVVETGAYRLVRHPIYAGYLLADLGFLLLNASAWNLAVFALVAATSVARVEAEERLLVEDPRYAAFVARVRFRLAPGLY